ncbi:hypothetical protein K8O61_00535 [Xanthomonas cerealis pv. cerealis]|uniref:hypothetical protein n=1 Tax=Xanthomonas cerealis TaxID=3390025 RepID=UPI001F21F2E0|nr:hypothetical protein [Xanthomonas translucens]UKE69632.1 hypothetical protein K8O61_00535 [Xanthomonas translucens pv. pistacia]
MNELLAGAIGRNTLARWTAKKRWDRAHFMAARRQHYGWSGAPSKQGDRQCA